MSCGNCIAGGDGVKRGIERFDAGDVLVVVGSICVGVVRVTVHHCVAYHAGEFDHKDWVASQVQVDGAVIVVDVLVGVDRRRSQHDDFIRVADDSCEAGADCFRPGCAAYDDHIGLGQFCDIGRRWFKVVRVGPLRHEAVDGDVIAGDVIDMVGYDIAHGKDGQTRLLWLGAGCLRRGYGDTGGQEEQQR